MMKTSSLNSKRAFMALLVRRKWWVLGPFIALSLAIALLIHLLPRMYVSESLIVIQPRGVPEDFVKDLIAGTAEQRLSAIEKTVLSRTNLMQLLEQFGGRLPQFRGLNMDEKVIKLRNRISVAFEAEKRMGVTVPLSYFRISFQDPNPELAQKITDKLTVLFIEQDKLAREIKVSGTTEFFSAELEKAEVELRLSDTNLKELKQARRYELPEQLETNLRTLDSLNLQKRANVEALDRNTTMRLILERQVSETPPTVAQESLGSRGALPKRPANPMVEEYRKKEIEYRQLTGKYTSIHPDVQRVKSELERLKKEIPQEDLIQVEDRSPAAPILMVPNPVYQSLTVQLRDVKNEFVLREKEKHWIESEIAKYSQRVQNAPAREQEIAAYSRANTELNKRYEDLKGKLAQARLAESLESGQKGSPFKVVDPANYPLLPSKPNKPVVILFGMAMSLGIGLGLALAIDLLNQKIWTQSEIEQIFDVPVLAEIPEIVTEADQSLARRKRIVAAALAGVSGTAYLGGLYFLYLWQMRVLKILDPIIQKVIY